MMRWKRTECGNKLDRQWWAEAGSAQEKVLQDSRHETKNHLCCVNDMKGRMSGRGCRESVDTALSIEREI